MPRLSQISKQLLECALTLENCNLGTIEHISYDDGDKHDPFGKALYVHTESEKSGKIVYVFNRHGLVNIINERSALLEVDDAFEMSTKVQDSLSATKAIMRCYAFTFGDQYVESELKYQKAQARHYYVAHKEALKTFNEKYIPLEIELLKESERLKKNHHLIKEELDIFRAKYQRFFNTKKELSERLLPFKFHNNLHKWIINTLQTQDQR